MRKSSPKVFVLLSLIGLCGLTVIVLIRNGMPKVVITAIALLSKYRALLPYVLAQARHETADFTSKVYKTDHNLFGMKFLNGRRDQNATQGLKSSEFDIDGTYYAHYVSDSASVIDLLKWFEVKNFPTTVSSVEQYANAIAAGGWFGSIPGNHVAIYIGGLKKYLNK